MAILTFDNIEQIENLSAQRPDLFDVGSPIVATPSDNGTWNLEVPDDQVETINGLNPYTPTKDQLKKRAASVRYDRETAGIDWNGAHIATDRDSQQALTGAASMVILDPTAQLYFKTQQGAVLNLNAEAIKALFLAVSGHVQAMRQIEAETATAIDSGEITTFDEVGAAFNP